MIKRLVDIFFSLTGLIVLSPLFIILSTLIIFDSGFPVFYIQKRVGKNNLDFSLLKFRSMTVNSDKQHLLTIGKDSRITQIGFFLRKYKLDELPQLLNVLIGDMSLVGPRPEVRKYVALYSPEQMRVLTIKPGITDYASIEYSNESEILGRSNNPEDVYIKEIMPAKIELNLKYIQHQSLRTDLKLIGQTFIKIFG